MKIRNRWGRWSRWAAFELIRTLYHERGARAPDSMIRKAYGLGSHDNGYISALQRHGRCERCGRFRGYGACKPCNQPWRGYRDAAEANDALKAWNTIARRQQREDR